MLSMDSLVEIGSSLPALQARSSITLDAESAPFGQEISPAEPMPTSASDSAKRNDPAADPELTLHFISHIDAECFISLLQILDPMPDGYRAQAEYKRFYRKLHETLEVPSAP